MKFAIFAFAAFWFAKFAAAAAESAAPVAVGALNLHDLGFKTWAKPASGCPLGTLPESVFLHKTVDHNDAHFTWVKPVHGLVNKLVCDKHVVWEGLADEVLLDFHFFGKTDGKMFAHVEHLTKLGGVAHVFLGFEGSAAGKAVGLAKFLAGVADLLGDKFLDVKGLPAHALLHELAFHHA
ncbi:hypothetical protein MACK_004096 [Theileria orientalis]|uniref:Uncharacterized protein n=1 Tax=Theileria orientalis TaxID=68886 RepID=A0A976XJK7_THEOR|nr:hypothetical protein MACK_004096 [Theileria orientalis]